MAHQTTGERRAADLAAIRDAALDYMQSWYEGDVGRMGRCLHPELAKRAILRDSQTGAERVQHLTQRDMLDMTQRGGGNDAPVEKRFYEVTILDVYGDIASARADSYEYVDYLQLARCEGQWLIVNALYGDRLPADSS
ncbi:MAG TPA: nuclear transport factor 2 family protein [Ktedonobacterales bacterium]|nr:nuclear transport factor 2 family protein [Ktedonobacterales bacterium]